MKVLVTGSSGFVGSALLPAFEERGHDTTRLVRGAPQAGKTDVAWDPAKSWIDAERLTGHDAVIHLAGESIVGRWSKTKKQRILESRRQGTRFLAETLATLPRPPRVLVSASAVGYYGDRGDDLLDEESTPGADFLAEVCKAWEAATEPARQRGIRVVRARIGMVLSSSGGALKRMLTPFRLGLGGRIGNGKQFMSWVSLEDLVSALIYLVEKDQLEGPFNIVAPHPVRNAEFTAILAKTLHRPAFLPMPASAARMAFGEMAEALLLSSARVEPRRLEEAGYSFRHTDLPAALGAVVARRGA